jgi:hypothetical protein
MPPKVELEFVKEVAASFARAICEKDRLNIVQRPST